ncbi:unnamed protein product [Psylliodes chrysocephalus]|uniref:Sodium channel protein Nach-like n=1 Tax=Psylliodes chrysocephalus TaxID=3402493 RepID=A0A9P0GA04_9CUCU|nr:unnamed protein product [Psylliodes chrysocephala]
MRLKNKERKKGFWSVVYETYKDFAENTSIHGLKYTVMKEIGTWEKSFWTIVVLSGFVTSVYLTFLFWERYVSNPTRTTIMSYYAPTSMIQFPAVTICNINRIMDSKVDTFMKTLQLDESEINSVKKALPEIMGFSELNIDNRYIKVFQNILEKNSIFNISYFMKNIVQNCSEMVKYCLWNNVPVNCLKSFKESLTVDGYCCSFNYGSTDTKYPYTDLNGFGAGISVILDPMLQPVQYSDYQSSGFKVIIHDPDEYPGFQSTTKMISSGTISYLQLYGIKMMCSDAVRNLPFSQRDCYYSDELELQTFTAYSYSNCVTECEAYYYYENCDCVPYYYDFIGKPECNISKLSCIHDTFSDGQDFSNICDCPSQCEDDYYDIISEYSSFDYEESMGMSSFGNTTITKDSVLINVFFNDQSQTIYLRDTIFSTIYLLSSFGGVYSLFLGCSLITVVEIIYYCMFRFFVTMKYLDRAELEEKPTNLTKIEISTVFNKQRQDTYFKSTFLP